MNLLVQISIHFFFRFIVPIFLYNLYTVFVGIVRIKCLRLDSLCIVTSRYVVSKIQSNIHI